MPLSTKRADTIRRRAATGLVLAAFTLACATDSPSSPTRGGTAAVLPVTIDRVADIENHGDARDLRVIFTEPGRGAPTSEHRIIVQKADAPVARAAAETLQSDRFTAVPSGAGTRAVDLPADLRDADGDAITEGVPYTVVVLTIGADLALEPVLSRGSAALTLARADLLLTLTVPFDAGGGGMELDAAGRIYHGEFGPTISQGNGTRVHRIDPDDGSIEVFATGLVGASGNAFDAAGNLVQANIGGNSLSRIDPSGQVTAFATGFQAPVGVVIDPGGDIFVANCGGASISRVTPAGVVTTHATSDDLACPNGLTLASDGNLYASNFGDGWVVRIEPDGTVSRFANIPGGSNAHILWGNDRLYVVGRAVPRIFEVLLDGSVRAIAGTGERGIDDGSALQATLSVPNDLALSADGRTLYINDRADVSSPNTVVAPSIVRMLRFVDP